MVKKLKADPIRDATISALTDVIDSLLDLMFEAGITVQQFNYLVRTRAVQAANDRVFRDTGRYSKSRVSIITGLPRSEVTKISIDAGKYVNARRVQSAARRTLTAWFENPKFLTPNGEPGTLSIFGKSRSFERLVLLHGGGIPVRAMLDELTQLDAVERVGDHQIKVKSRIPISGGITPPAIEAIGQRCADLIQTMMKNARSNRGGLDGPLFAATSIAQNANVELMSEFRREISRRGKTFIAETNSLLRKKVEKASKIAGSYPSAEHRVGVTVYYFEHVDESNPVTGDGRKPTPRFNLRRLDADRQKRKSSVRRKNS